MDDSNVRDRSASFTERALIFQEGVKTDVIPLIKKLLPSRMGKFFGHSIVELKEKSASSSTLESERSENVQKFRSSHIKTAEKIGTQIGRFINMLAALNPKKLLDETVVTHKKIPPNADDDKVLEPPKEPASVFQTIIPTKNHESTPVKSQELVQVPKAAQAFEKEAKEIGQSKTLSFPQKLEKLASYLTEFDRQEKLADAPGADKRKPLDREKLNYARKLVAAELEGLPSKVRAFDTEFRQKLVGKTEKEKIALLKDLLQTYQAMAKAAADLPKTGEIIHVVSKLDLFKKNLEREISINESKLKCNASTVLDANTLENVSIIREFYRPKNIEKYQDSKLVFNPVSQKFSIVLKEEKLKGFIEGEKKITKEINKVFDSVLLQIKGKIFSPDLIFGEGITSYSLRNIYDDFLENKQVQNNHTLWEKLVALNIQIQADTPLERDLQEWLKPANYEVIEFLKAGSDLKGEEQFKVTESADQLIKDADVKLTLDTLMAVRTKETDQSFLAVGAELVSEIRAVNNDPIKFYNETLAKEQQKIKEEIERAQENLKKHPENRESTQSRIDSLRDLLKTLPQNLKYLFLKNELLDAKRKVAINKHSAAFEALNKIYNSYCDKNFLRLYPTTIELGEIQIEHARWNAEALKALKEAGVPETFSRDFDEINTLFERCTRDKKTDYLPELMEKLQVFITRYPPRDDKVLAEARTTMGTPLPKLIENRNPDKSIKDDKNPALAKEWNEKWGSKKVK